MSFTSLIRPATEFIKKNWKEILGAIGAIGKLLLFILSKIANVPNSYWITFAFIWWLFIFLWAWFSRNHSRAIPRAVVIVALVVSFGNLIYFGTVGSVYFFAEPPPAIGETFKAENSIVTLKGSGLTDQALNEHYVLGFAEPADYAEAEFTVSGVQQNLVRELLLTYRDLPEYQDKVKKSGSKVGVRNVAPGFDVDIVLLAELTAPTQNPEINVRVTKKFARQNRYWRFKRWVFERYSD